MMAEHKGQQAGESAGNNFNSFVLSSKQRLALPIALYPALALTGASVRDIVTNPQAQCEAAAALQARYRRSFVLSAMDLSAEAEAFGCAIQMADNEIPSVIGRLVTLDEQVEKLPMPQPGDKRTRVHLEAIRLLSKLPGQPRVLGGCIGPFSLAARLVGVSEAMELTVTEPALIHALLEKATTFLTAYVRAFRDSGASGIIMAEPAAGLLSPRALAALSSAYVRSIGEAVEDDSFSIVLHNCAAKLIHLPAVLESGRKAFHFGAPMDIVAALGKVPSEVVLCGNLDPTTVFVQMQPGEVTTRVNTLLTLTRAHRNFVMSSGCDLPPSAPLASLDAFYAANSLAT